MYQACVLSARSFQVPCVTPVQWFVLSAARPHILWSWTCYRRNGVRFRNVRTTCSESLALLLSVLAFALTSCEVTCHRRNGVRFPKSSASTRSSPFRRSGPTFHFWTLFVVFIDFLFSSLVIQESPQFFCGRKTICKTSPLWARFCLRLSASHPKAAA